MTAVVQEFSLVSITNESEDDSFTRLQNDGSRSGVGGVVGLQTEGDNVPINAATNDINFLEDIVARIRGLSAEHHAMLCRQLNMSNESCLCDFIDCNNESPTLSIEQRMMTHMEYRVHKQLLLYIPPIIIIFGTFGNLFAFVILKNKAMLKFSTYFFLMVMAVADTMVLYVGLLPLWIAEKTSFNLRNWANWTCKLSNIIGSTVSDYSVWLIVAVTAERYLVVCHPFRAGDVCSTPRARRLVVVLFVAFVALNSHFFCTVGIRDYGQGNDVTTECLEATEDYYLLVRVVWPWVDALVYSSLPFVVILCLNILIVRQVIIARQQRECLHGSRKFRQRRPSQEGSTRLTLMLLTISFTFLVTTLPMSIVAILAAFLDQSAASDLDLNAKRRSRFRLARTVAELLMYSNHAINFYLYCATGQKFRHQLVWMVCYARRSYCRSTEAVLTAAVGGNHVAPPSAANYAAERHSSTVPAVGVVKLSAGACAHISSGLKRASGGSVTGSSGSSSYQLKQRLSGGRASGSSSMKQRQRLFASGGECSSSSCRECDCVSMMAVGAADDAIELRETSSGDLDESVGAIFAAPAFAAAAGEQLVMVDFTSSDVIDSVEDRKQDDQYELASLDAAAAVTSGQLCGDVEQESISTALTETDSQLTPTETMSPRRPSGAADQSTSAVLCKTNNAM